MASFEGMTQPVFGQLKKSATVSLAFNCKPQRYIISDEEGVTIQRGSPLTITNYGDIAKPRFEFNNSEIGGSVLWLQVVDSAYPDDMLIYKAPANVEDDPDFPIGFYIDTQSMENVEIFTDGHEEAGSNLEIDGWAEHFGKQEPFLELQHGHTYTFTINERTSGSAHAYLRRWEL